MKELTIEQKAKAYDEVRKKIAIRFCSNVAEEIFSEYEESEDERMVKFIKNQLFNIKKTITENYELDAKLTNAIDWLEKQGEHANFRNKIQICDKVTRNEDGVLVNLSQLNIVAKKDEKQGKNDMGISETTKRELEGNLNKALEKETPESCNEFLEKQSEQKPVDFDLRTWEYIVDAVWTEKEGIGQYLDSPSTEEVAKKLQKRFGNIEQKSVDKVEPKFKVGDIIRHKEQGFTCKIIAVDTEYRLSECNGTHLPFDSQNAYELVEQKPTAWSEDDETNASYICAALESYYRLREDRNNTNGQEYLDKARNWLYNRFKSIRPQNTWKPSDEQMNILFKYAEQNNKDGSILTSLYQDLKKLREKM